MTETGIQKAARVTSSILSILFHPAFVPLYGLLIIFCAPTFMYYVPFNIKKIIFLLAAVNMTIVPLALLPFLRYRGVISSYSIEDRVERVIPLGIGTMMYGITTFVLYSYQIPVLIKSFMLGATITSFLVLVMTFRWKISIHSAGAGGLLATIFALSLRTATDLTILLVPSIILAGALMTSRLYLSSHNSSQVYSGFILGFATFIITMMIR